MSQRNILPPSSDFLPDLLFNPEDGGYVFFWNISWFSVHYVALYPGW
jgi:hypothetical protein